MLVNILIAVAALVAAAVAVILILAARKPDVFRVHRSATIRAPAERIYPLVASLRGFARWSPYEKKDPDMRREFDGPEAGIGASYAWAGDRNVGRGRITVVDAEAPGRVEMSLDMLSPMKVSNIVEFTLAPQGDATLVTWAMRGKTPFFCKILQTLFDMDKMCGRDFEAGLADLEALVEGRPVASGVREPVGATA